MQTFKINSQITLTTDIVFNKKNVIKKGTKGLVIEPINEFESMIVRFTKPFDDKDRIISVSKTQCK